MAKRFDAFYKTERLDNLGDPEWHNRRWQDIDLRMHARELDATAIEGAVDRMEAIALSRLNDTFSPLIEQAINQLADVGVSFQGRSLTQQTIGPGEKSFLITEQYRVGLVVVDFVSIRPTDVGDAAMICNVLSYDRPTGVLRVEPQEGYITGSGTYSDWQIKVSVTPNLDTYSREEVDGQIEIAVDHLVGEAPLDLNTLEKIAIAIGGMASQTQGGPTSTVCLRTNNLSDVLSPAAARANIGLGSVDNTRDANKPVSAPQSAAIAAVVAQVFPTGTTMMFAQQVVPSGWIRSTTHHDKTLRVVNTEGGTSGGIQNWSVVFGRTTVDNTTLDGNNLPYHAHSLYDPGHAHSVADYTHDHSGWLNFNADQDGGARGAYSGYASYNACIWNGARGDLTVAGNYSNIAIYGAGTGMGVYAAGGSTPHTHGIDLRCKYVDVLIGVKA
jgi:hypothetical protein